MAVVQKTIQDVGMDFHSGHLSQAFSRVSGAPTVGSGEDVVKSRLGDSDEDDLVAEGVRRDEGRRLLQDLKL